MTLTVADLVRALSKLPPDMELWNNGPFERNPAVKFLPLGDTVSLGVWDGKLWLSYDSVLPDDARPLDFGQGNGKVCFYLAYDDPAKMSRVMNRSGDAFVEWSETKRNPSRDEYFDKAIELAFAEGRKEHCSDRDLSILIGWVISVSMQAYAQYVIIPPLRRVEI